jgi:cytochrome c biogenesis protein CcmG/thiol:disulfide interchange protein DsbE
MKNKYLTLMVLLILIGLIIMQNVVEHGKKTEAGLSSSHIKGQAVSFSLMGLDGQSYGIDGKREKPLILNFWESWCDPCKKEAPNLKLLYEYR